MIVSKSDIDQSGSFVMIYILLCTLLSYALKITCNIAYRYNMDFFSFMQHTVNDCIFFYE